MSVVVAAVLITSGMATRYNPTIMQSVVANRIMWGHLPEGTDPTKCVALMDCDRIGDRVWVEVSGKVFGPLTVADCAAKQDVARLTHLSFAVDLSWELAQRTGVMAAPVRGVKVWNADPRPKKTPVSRKAAFAAE